MERCVEGRRSLLTSEVMALMHHADADNGMVTLASTVHQGITGSAARLATMLRDNAPEARRTLVQASRRRKGGGGSYETHTAPQPRAISDYIARMGGTCALSVLGARHGSGREGEGEVGGVVFMRVG